MAEKTDAKDTKSKKKPMILIKKIKKSGGGHHGGAWKVAYADFVTAMMAFFLLLWLLNVSTKEQLESIADYFKPSAASVSTSGAGGVMGGLNMTVDGQMTNNKEITATSENRPSDAEEESEEISDSKKEVSEESFEKLKAQEEQKQFEKAMDDIKQAIQDDPSLKDLANNLIVDMTPEGLRIQIVDQQGKSMFPLGSAKMYDETNLLIAKVSTVISRLPQKISIRGHTDGVPYGDAATYDNWNLSADRANASRQALVLSGLDQKRISNVSGKADTEHLFPKDPTSPQNRRISIILMREYKAADKPQ
jgi:chemotaxis protein MotB